MRKFLTGFVEFLGSFGLAAAILVLLMILTLAGTFEQGHSTLYDVQKRYFESPWLIHYVAGRYPVPLLGGLFLLPLLFVNLLVGGILRMRKGKSTLGVFIVHIGIVVMLVGSAWEASVSTKGSLTVYEPRGRPDGMEVGDTYISSQDWELAIVRPEPGGGQTEFVIPQDEFDDLDADDRLRCRNPDLPFDLVLSNYMRNSKAIPAPPEAARGEVVDGRVLREMEPIGKQDENRSANFPGLYATLVDPTTGNQRQLLLWGRDERASTATVGGRSYGIYLRRQTWQLPFTVRLDRFVHETHPGTRMARRFSSYVTITDERGGDRAERKVHITMNEPLRYEGYTLYQSSWGPEPGPRVPPDARLYSGFSVVYNPSDKIPLISCIIILVGLVLHFGRKLWLHLKAESRRQAHVRSAAQS